MFQPFTQNLKLIRKLFGQSKLQFAVFLSCQLPVAGIASFCRQVEGKYDGGMFKLPAILPFKQQGGR